VFSKHVPVLDMLFAPLGRRVARVSLVYNVPLLSKKCATHDESAQVK